MYRLSATCRYTIPFFKTVSCSERMMRSDCGYEEFYEESSRLARLTPVERIA